jgi:hypothetical protein
MGGENEGKAADYLMSGHWSEKARNEAKMFGKVNEVAKDPEGGRATAKRGAGEASERRAKRARGGRSERASEPRARAERSERGPSEAPEGACPLPLQQPEEIREKPPP